MPPWKLEWRQSLTFKLLVFYMLAWVLTASLVGAVLWLVVRRRRFHAAKGLQGRQLAEG